MTNREVVSHKQRIDNLFQLAGKLGADPELIAHWSRYLCILASGFIENSVRIIISEYAEKRAHSDIANYVSEQLRYFSNAKMEKILELIAEFNSDKRTDYERAVQGAIKEAVDSIVNNRHQIAHGQNTGIGFATIKEYFNHAVKAIDELEQRFS
jgi:hypothetical protein